MNKFETKKKLLVAESEVYRQLLKMEIEAFKVYAVRTRRRFTSVKSFVPLVIPSLRFASRFFGRKRRLSLKKALSLALFGWKTYQRFSPMFGARFSGKPASTPTAAEEYLSKRL